MEDDEDDEQASLHDSTAIVPGESSLSPEQEDELARELAAVTTSLTGNWDEEEDALDPAPPMEQATDQPMQEVSTPEANKKADERKAHKLASPVRAMLTGEAVQETDASRLLDEANKELNEPEGSRRRTAIAHLRAAVAATRADKALGQQDSEGDPRPYKEDLAAVVMPLKPIRQAPLQLIAEQRVSEPAPKARTEAPNAGNFAEYAAKLGSLDLPELLEAAASYISFVEGRAQFSRPQLMTTLLQAEKEASSREDRLRSFGLLLREGKIEKAGSGRFTASERIGFKPRRAVG